MIQNKKSVPNSFWKTGFATLHSLHILAPWRPVLLSESKCSDQWRAFHQRLKDCWLGHKSHIPGLQISIFSICFLPISNDLKVNIAERLQESKKPFHYFQWPWHKLHKVTTPGGSRTGMHSSSAVPGTDVFAGTLLEEAHSIWLAVASSPPYEANVIAAVQFPLNLTAIQPMTITYRNLDVRAHGSLQDLGKRFPATVLTSPVISSVNKGKNSCCSQKHERFSHLILLGVTSETPQTHSIVSQMRTRKPCSVS